MLALSHTRTLALSLPRTRTLDTQHTRTRSGSGKLAWSPGLSDSDRVDSDLESIRFRATAWRESLVSFMLRRSAPAEGDGDSMGEGLGERFGDDDTTDVLNRSESPAPSR